MRARGETAEDEHAERRSRAVGEALEVAGLGGRRGLSDMDASWATVLGEVPLFARLSKRHLRRVARLAKCARFAPGQRIVLEGSSCEAFYVLLEGEAEVLPPGHEPVPLGAGEFFGELGLLDGGQRTATVAASSEVVAMKIPRASFHRLLDREPAIARALLAELAARMRTARR
jgi:CRP-like cAMP-binding protein